jgi:hypothetical protein
MNLETGKALIDAFVAFENNPDLVGLLPKRLQKFVRQRQASPEFMQKVETTRVSSAPHRLLAPLLFYSQAKAHQLRNLDEGELKILAHAYFAWKTSPVPMPFFEELDDNRDFQIFANGLVQNEVQKQDPGFSGVQESMSKDVEKILKNPKVEQIPEIETYHLDETPVSFISGDQVTTLHSNNIEGIREKIDSIAPPTPEDRSKNLLLQHLIWNGYRTMMAIQSAGVAALATQDGRPVFKLTNTQNAVQVQALEDGSYRVSYKCTGNITTTENPHGEELNTVFSYELFWNKTTQKWDVSEPLPGAYLQLP